MKSQSAGTGWGAGNHSMSLQISESYVQQQYVKLNLLLNPSSSAVTLGWGDSGE